MMHAHYIQAATKEVRVGNQIRQTHCWLSIIFTVTVIANFVAIALGDPPAWVVYSPLPPLFVMLVTRLYIKERCVPSYYCYLALPAYSLQKSRALIPC